MVVEKILIKFGDNDFTQIYRIFGEAIQEMMTDVNCDTELTEDNIIELWNQSCYGLYVLFQNRLEYSDAKGRIGTGEYLKITKDKKRVLLNKEVDEYLERIEMDGNMENLYIDGYSIQII